MIKTNGTKWSMIWSNKICNFPVRIVQCIWNVSWSSRGVLMHRWGIAAGDWRKLVVCLLNSPKVILERDVYHYAIEHGEKDPQNMQGEIKLTFMILTLYEVGFNTLDFSTAISVEGICFNLSRLSISFFLAAAYSFINWCWVEKPATQEHTWRGQEWSMHGRMWVSRTSPSGFPKAWETLLTEVKNEPLLKYRHATSLSCLNCYPTA